MRRGGRNKGGGKEVWERLVLVSVSFSDGLTDLAKREKARAKYDNDGVAKSRLGCSTSPFSQAKSRADRQASGEMCWINSKGPSPIPTLLPLLLLVGSEPTLMGFLCN